MKHETRHSLNAGFIHRCNFNPVKFHRCFSKQHWEQKQGDLSSQTQFLYPSMPFFLRNAARFFFLSWKIKWLRRSTKREEDNRYGADYIRIIELLLSIVDSFFPFFFDSQYRTRVELDID